MIFDEMIEQAAQNVPVSAMFRSLLEHSLSAKDFDDLFEQYRQRQYTRFLLFSTVVALVVWVVCKVRPSTKAAMDAVGKILNVSRTSVYNKLIGIETQVSAAIVALSAMRLAPIIDEMGPLPPSILPGYEVRIVDGSCIAATQHRLKILREISSGPLPGKALVIFDPQRSLATCMIPSEDGHAQERSLFEPLLDKIKKGELSIADRNFCTRGFLQGIHDRQSAFVIREHASLPWIPLTELRPVPGAENLEEQTIRLHYSLGEKAGEEFPIRRIVVHLDKPTRDGDMSIAILTNIPQEHADAQTIANAYRKRWTIEKHFGLIERALASEISSLGFPKAALFILAIALMVGNIFSVIMAALQHAHPSVNIEETVSPVKIAEEVQSTYGGMTKFTGDAAWECFSNLSTGAIVLWLLRCAKNVELVCFRKTGRGPKKPRPKRSLYQGKHPHVSTYQLLQASTQASMAP
jgi:hypothetical protein